MALVTIKAGENVLIKLGLFTMADGLTFIGTWDDATAYVVDNVVVHESVAYKCILNHTNHEPPNVTYWEALPIIEVADIVSLAVALQLSTASPKVNVVSWLYQTGQPTPPNMVIEDGLLTIELLNTDSAALLGTYDLVYIVTVVDALYPSGGQTDILCLDDVLEVQAC